MSCERRYLTGYEYLRFTNNLDYEMLKMTANLKGINVEFVKQLIAFSHWSFQVRTCFKFCKNFLNSNFFSEFISEIIIYLSENLMVL